MKLFRFKVVGLLVFLVYSLSFATEHRPEVLTEVRGKVNEALEEGKKPIVIFDLDDTLINTRDRNLRILKDFIKQQEVQDRFPNEVALVRKIRLSHVKYLLSDTLKGRGISNEDFLKEANAFWVERFFTNKYCEQDRAMTGASRYVRSLHDLGATIVYLTGRDKPRMGEGTESNLRLLGFPFDSDDVVLMMKPQKEMDDLAFKVGAFDSIEKMGNVVAAFENEPANINALQRRFPDGAMAFVDSIHSPKPDIPNAGIFWVRDFVERSPVDEVTHKCDKKAISNVYQTYKEECDGYGSKSSCLINSRDFLTTERITIDAECGYSGEPDYSDHARLIMVFNPQNCELIRSKTLSCYSD